MGHDVSFSIFWKSRKFDEGMSKPNIHSIFVFFSFFFILGRTKDITNIVIMYTSQ